MAHAEQVTEVLDELQPLLEEITTGEDRLDPEASLRPECAVLGHGRPGGGDAAARVGGEGPEPWGDGRR